MVITREATFDTAHLLSNYSGKCNNLHGHTYRIQVTMHSNKGLQEEGNNQGMVLDFNIVKDLLKEVVDEHFDHAIVFSAENFREPFENELLELVKKYGKRHFIMPERKSTAECMAIVIKEMMTKKLAEKGFSNLGIDSIKLWETPNSFVEA